MTQIAQVRAIPQEENDTFWRPGFHANGSSSRLDRGRSEGSVSGRGDGGNNGGGRNNGGDSIADGRGATGARVEPYYIYDSYKHFWRKCPELLYQRCKKKGHSIIYCKGTEDARMPVSLTGAGADTKEEVVKTYDESAVGSEAEREAFTTVEDGTSECLLS